MILFFPETVLNKKSLRSLKSPNVQCNPHDIFFRFKKRCIPKGEEESRDI